MYKRQRQAITRAIADQARTIRIPVHMVETINKVIRVSRQDVYKRQVVDRLEKEGEGLNLTWEVRNGIVCHTRGCLLYTSRCV